MAVGLTSLLLGCSTVAIAPPGDAQGRLAAEFVTAHPSDSTRRGWSDDIFPAAASLGLMRRLSASNGWRLAGVALLQLGVHPYAAVVFLERGAEFRVIHTEMYWGSVRGKWVVEVPSDRGRATLRELGSLFDCGSDPAPEAILYGPLVVTWDSADRMTVCSAKPFSEQAALVGPPLESLFVGGKRTYAPIK